MDPRIQQAIALMLSDLRQEVLLTEIAQSMNMSESRLRHLFTIETSLSPLQYLKAQRMLRVKELLENSHYNIKQIMLLVGIKDQSHFVRDFQKAYGLSPHRYRAQYLRNTTLQSNLVRIADTANK